MQQGPQYPYQQYQQYPGYPPPKPGGKTALIVVLVVAGVLVLAGAGVGAFFLLTGNDKRSAAPPATSTSPAGEPDKYTALPRCPEVGSRMTDLPPLEKDAAPEPATTSVDDLTMTRLDCSWRKAGSSSGQVSLYLVQSKVPGSGAGPSYAKAGYDTAVDDGATPITGIGQATKAAQVDYKGALLQCGVRFYQGNIDAEVIVSAAGRDDKDVERCRKNAKNLAEAVSDSIS